MSNAIITPARRIPIEADPDPIRVLKQPGDYCGPVTIDGEPERTTVWFLVPAKTWMGAEDPDSSVLVRLARVASPPHVFRECLDGSLEIRESIRVTHRWAGVEETWHGYLDEGNQWRQV